MGSMDYTKDFMGNVLEVGDIVAVIATVNNNSSTLKIAEVVGFTAKRIKVRYVHSSRPSADDLAWKAPKHVTKIGRDDLRDTPLEWLRELITLNK